MYIYSLYLTDISYRFISKYYTKSTHKKQETQIVIRKQVQVAAVELGS